MLEGATKCGGSVFYRLSTRGYPNDAGFGSANRTKGSDARAADEFHRAVTKDGFRPFRLLLADGQEVHVLGDNEYGLDQGTMTLGADLRYIDAADVERVEPLPYRVIDEDLADLAKA